MDLDNESFMLFKISFPIDGRGGGGMERGGEEIDSKNSVGG